MKNKHIILILVFIIIGFGIKFLRAKVDVKNETSQVNQIQVVEERIPPKETTIVFVGDIMLDRAVRTSVVKNFGGDYNKLFTNISELKGSDILFGNLEGPVSLVGNNVGSKYSFRMDPIALDALKNAGFDIVSFANNHVGDWSINAFTDTLKRLSEFGIEKTGAGITKSDAQTPTIIEKNGVKFGFLGFSDVGPDWMKASETNPGIILASDPEFNRIISDAKQRVDVLIVSVHWGVEYKNIHNKRQEDLAHRAIDSGADLVIGHHPHVIEDVEIYKDKPIAYSLGNFIFDQYFSKDTMEGMVFEATFEGKTLKETKQILSRQNKMYQIEGIFDIKEKNTSAENTCPKPKKEYEDYSYLNVGQAVAIPELDYIPSDLIKLDKSISTGSICLKKETNESLKAMIDKAKEDGYILKVSSGFRSYQTQKTIFEENKKNGNKNTSIAIAKPGHSEHQLGTTVDLTSPSIGEASANKKFANTSEAIWLEKNSYLYGFIRSYPEGKEDITGYMYEPWHYRFVGLEKAKEIFESGQTLSEFLK